MDIELSDAEAEALAQELAGIVQNNNRYPLSPRVQMLRGILGKLRPEPVRERLPPPRKVYAPPRAVVGRRGQRG